MKQLIFVLAMLPLLSKAQDKDKDNPLNKKNDGNLELVHAGKTYKQPAIRKENSPKKLKDNEIYVGDVQFKIGDNQVSCDSAILYTNDGLLVASHVKITNPESFDLTSDLMTFNKEDNTADLADNITVTARNGDLVGTSASFKIDFSYNIYRVTGGSIIPPAKKP
jgi:lipopolysaccharide assembly outer membrane protein LptD (OstA)